MVVLSPQLDELGIAAAVLTVDDCIAAANDAFAKTLGRSAVSLAGCKISPVIESAATASEGRCFRFRNGDEIRWMTLERRQVNGATVALLSDVSEQRDSLDAVRGFYETRDRLLHDGKIGTWRYDPDAEIYHFSSELSLGHEGAGAPVPVAILQLLQHPGDVEKDTEIRERITREGGSANAEMRYLESDGSWTHLNVHYRSGRQLPSGRFEMFGISQSITAVANARDDANQMSRRLTLALRSARSGVFEYDYSRKQFWMSPELKQLLGREAVARAEENPLALFADNDRSIARATFAAAATDPQTAFVDLLVHTTGASRWMRFYFGVSERDAEGEPRLGIGLLFDIDDQKRQEIALGDARRAAEFANRTKTEFLANMSHELRTPLNAILGFSEIIERQMFGAIGEKYAGYAHDIHRSGSHLLELVNDVLDLSKLEAGKLVLRETTVRLADLVDECLALVRGRAEEDGVRFETDIAPLSLIADPRAMRQLLLNFLSNAVKFTPRNGCVTVRANCDPLGEICLSVSDTGIGMTAAEIEVALSPFGQIHSKRARSQEGTGLGLPICKSLLELHGGELSVTSEPGKGTTLTARFPADRTETLAESTAA